MITTDNSAMTFEIKITGNEVWTMRAAGVEMTSYLDLFHKVLSEKVKLPATVTCPYFLSDDPVDVKLTVLALGHFKVEVPNPQITHAIQEELKKFTRPGRSTKEADKALCAEINRILKPDGFNLDDVEANKATLSRRAQEELMKLCATIHFIDRGQIYWQFTKAQIPKSDREFVARWLIQRFAVEKDSMVRNDINTVFLNRSDLISRKLTDQVIPLVKNPRLGTSRSGMIYVLAKTKHPQAADIIASVMDQDRLAWSSLRALASLKANQYEKHIRKYLRHPDSDIRREAKRALKKLGCEMEPAPAPVHLQKNRKQMPRDLEEWSANLDFDQLAPVLNTLSGCITKGFGPEEIAEVLGVAEETRPEQTKAFRFPITYEKQASELWLVIFLDDIDSPDLEIHAPAALVGELDKKVKLDD